MLSTRTFGKSEHLCGEKTIARVFAEGNAFIVFPLRVVYLLFDESNEISVKMMVSVPKKKLKRAVKRNRMKRIIREAYRLNKEELLFTLQHNNKQLLVAFSYLSDQETPFNEIELKIRQAFRKIVEKSNLSGSSVV